MLSPGSRIAVVAPSGAFDPARLARSIELVSSWGYQLVEGRHLHARDRYTAGTRAQRVEDLSWALTAPDIDAVWFARGGYGTVHTLDQLPWDRVDDRPVIGFSDATALFCAMATKGLGRPVHGPVLHSLADHVDDPSRAWLRALLAGTAREGLKVRPLLGGEARIEGPLVGGNLCVMASLAGTPWLRAQPGAVLLLEDLHEPPYKLDRMITQLWLGGALEGLAAIILGEFLSCAPRAGSDWSLDELFVDLLKPLGIPVYADAPIGHGSQNRAMVLGSKVQISAGELHVV